MINYMLTFVDVQAKYTYELVQLSPGLFLASIIEFYLQLAEQIYKAYNCISLQQKNSQSTKRYLTFIEKSNTNVNKGCRLYEQRQNNL